MKKILSTILILLIFAAVAFAVGVGVSDCKAKRGAFATSEDVYPVTAAVYRSNANLTVYADETETDEEIIVRETEAPETSVFESEEDNEQTASEEDDETVQSSASEMVEEEGAVQVLAQAYEERASVETEGKGSYRDDRITYYGIWTGAYWHFTPEQIDAQWAGYKTYKPVLPSGTTRAWQQYLYDKLAERGAEWFYKYAVAQAMQESGFNPLNQQGNDAVPDKGLFAFRIYYWNEAKYGDVYDYHANINAYVDRIAPYLTDSSEAGIYRAISQHYLPSGTTHMNYVNMVLGRLNELWEVE